MLPWAWGREERIKNEVCGKWMQRTKHNAAERAAGPVGKVNDLLANSASKHGETDDGAGLVSMSGPRCPVTLRLQPCARRHVANRMMRGLSPMVDATRTTFWMSAM